MESLRIGMSFMKMKIAHRLKKEAEWFLKKFPNDITTTHGRWRKGLVAS